MKILQNILFAFFLAIFCDKALANIVITGTRIIYPENVKSITVKLANEGNFPSLVQSWIDSGDLNSNPAKTDSPFLITPPVTRVEPNQGQDLRIIYSGEGLPTNKESVFWLNVLDIPSKQDSVTGNQLSLAIRSRLKVFYRPTSINSPTEKSYQDVRFSSIPEHSNVLQVKNNSPFYMTILNIQLPKTSSFKELPTMIPPFSSITLNGVSKIIPGEKITFSIVDDYGAVNKETAVIE